MSGLKHSFDDGSRQQQQKRQKIDQHNLPISPSLPVRLSHVKPFVVRVSGIPPCEGSASRVKSWLKDTISEISNDESDCISDITVVPSCTGTDNLVALVDFKVLPEFFSCLKKGSSRVCKVPERDGCYLDFNPGFVGFTQMYSTTLKPTADIIFISGIGSHTYGSWASKSDPWLMWPRHFLPKSLPTARVMVYGHKADIRGLGFGDLLDYGRSFGHALQQVRKEDPDRPVVFVAHSFGGNILKSFLVKDQHNGGPTLNATCGILFFAVPQRGMDVEDMIAAIMYSNTAEKRLRQISKDESYWRQELDNFVDIIKDRKVASFYETALTNRLIMKPDGSFARDGEPTTALDTRSAILDLPTSIETKHPVDSDHSAIVKFESENCQEYIQALHCLNEHLRASRHMSGQLDEATMKCLRNLHVTDPELDMKRIEHSKDLLLKDCYAWILKDSKLREWRDSNACPLLWINGDPGKGKTMLMIALVQELSKCLPSDVSALTFFFCQSTDTRLKSAVSILRGLIWKLAMNNPRLAKLFCAKYESDKALFEGPNAIYTLFSALSLMLQNCPGTILLVDALDECDSATGRDQLLDLIMEDAKSASKAKWLISSRNYAEIKRKLELKCHLLSLELNEAHISEAVDLYINHKVSELAQQNDYDEELTAQVKGHLQQNSEGTFLWVALVCKTLHDIQSFETVDAVKEFPSGLQPLYNLMIERVENYPRVGTAEFCRLILSAVTIAFRPLHLKELVFVAGLPVKRFQNIKSVNALINSCGSFLTIRDDVVYFIHQSAKDYFSTGAGLRIFSAGIIGEHSLVVDRSLSALSGILERNMCKLGHPGSQVYINTVDNRIKAIRYICCFWVDHLTNYLDGDSTNSSINKKYLLDGGPIHHFLLKHLLHWFEALSLFKEVDRGILALQGLKTMIRTRPIKLQPEFTPSLENFIHDALRIFFRCRPALEEAPLQIYNASLLFAPLGSAVRRHFSEQIPNWIHIIPQIQNNWSPCLQTLEGHTGSVNSVAFSPNGQQLASAAGDRTVRLWDAATGAALQTLEGHTDSVNSVAFSPDGQQLASASWDCTVRLWDAATGAVLQTLEGHTGSVNSVAFSPDGQQLASASWDCTVRLWDAATGAVLQTLEGHTGSVKSVAFSPDGQQLASASYDDTVRLWDAATGAVLQTLEGHTSGLNSVAFSPDGQQLASASWDCTVRLWDAATGAVLQTLEGHTGSVNSVAFSPDGQQLASASYDDTVRLWDAATGAVLQTLEGHTSSVNSVAFSPDGQQLASASWDCTVRLWDAATGAVLQTLEGHTGSVNSVAFSPDGQQLASASYDDTVRLWNAATGAALQTLEGHTSGLNSVAFSPDGQQLASASDDCTVRLWDAATGAALQTLESHTDSVNSVAFSPDGQQLASASDDCTVRLWDAATGAALQTLESHTDSVNSVAFSPDGQQLASASDDCTVRLWDAATGAALQTLEGHTSGLNSVAFSPDGQQLASASDDGTVRLWDAATGAALQTLEGHTDSVNSVAFSPDGTVRLWDAATGAALQTLEGHTSNVNSVAFIPDGQNLITSLRVFSLNQPYLYSNQNPGWTGYGINREEKWITWKSNNFLWLPPEYRPSTFSVDKHRIAVGCGSGRVYFLNFSPGDSPLNVNRHP